MDDRTADMLRRYAGGEITSRSLRDATDMTYGEVLGELGRLGLRPPIARLDGINGPALRRGRDLLQSWLVEPSPR